MKGQTHGGKGSSPRPTNKRRFDENYEKIFNKTPSEGESQLDERVHIAEADGRGGESKFREYVESAGVQGQTYEEQAVAWLYEKPLADGFSERTLSFGAEPEFEGKIIPLYAHPPKQEQVIEQDPVAWRVYYEVNGHYIIFQQFPYGLKQLDDQRDIQPLYAHPPKRQPLSDEYIESVIYNWDDVDEEIDLVEFARVIEKAHEIK